MTGQPQHYPSCSACGGESLERGLFGGARWMGKERWVVAASRRGSFRHLELFARERA